MQDGGQQTLVAQHDCATVAGSHAPFVAEPLAHIASLYAVGGSTDEGDVFLFREMVVDVGVVVEFVGEFVDEFFQQFSCFVGMLCRLRGQVVMVEVPVEDGLPLLAKALEESSLHFLQGVEAHEGVGVAAEVSFLVVHHFAVESSLIGQALSGQPLVEVGVDVAETAPQLEESLFQQARMVFTEVLEEMLEHFHLVRGEVFGGVIGMQVAEVGKQALCVGHALVDVVEVGEQHLPPGIELVEAVVASRTRDEAFPEFEDEFDVVGHDESGVLAEEVADGGDGWAPQRLVGQS